MPKTIKQTVMFKASPHEVYEVLMDSKKHAAFTGAEARIGRKIGEKFFAYDEYIDGVNLELEKDKKITQAWRASDWPAGHYSTAIFELAKVKTGTRLIFTQTNVPSDQFEAISRGWEDHYWEKMKKFFAEKPNIKK